MISFRLFLEIESAVERAASVSAAIMNVMRVAGDNNKVIEAFSGGPLAQAAHVFTLIRNAAAETYRRETVHLDPAVFTKLHAASCGLRKNAGKQWRHCPAMLWRKSFPGQAMLCSSTKCLGSPLVAVEHGFVNTYTQGRLAIIYAACDGCEVVHWRPEPSDIFVAGDHLAPSTPRHTNTRRTP